MEYQETDVATGTYCVTGASGYIGSWLVKTLLHRGHTVHATVRNPDKASHFVSKWNGGERLKMFKADLQEEGSFDEAVKGCDGVFHVAASMEFNVTADREDLEAYVQSNIIDPAVRGVINVLKSCLKSKSVRRVVFTSSISTMTAKDSQGNWIPVVDESCQSPIDRVWKTKASGWMYVLSKRMSEEAAFRFANENGLDLVSIIVSTVAGPFLTTTLPSSIRVILSPVAGEAEYYSILSAVNARMGSIALVHIEDICRAHVFLMDHTQAEGRYISCVRSCSMSELLYHLYQHYPSANAKSCWRGEGEGGSVPSVISSKKLADLGFKYKYVVKDIVAQTISCCVKHGFLASIVQ